MNDYWEVFQDSISTQQAFRKPTISDVCAILNLIGVTVRKYPSHCNFSKYKGLKWVSLDPHQNIDALVDASKLSPDGNNRLLRGLARK